MGKCRSNRYGMFRVGVVFAYCGLLAACSGLFGEPAPVSVSPVYKISGAPAADTSGPVVAEIRPGAQGELRFVIIPPEQAVR
jgi:hypothetical protein